jgi:hypothetical protein
MRNEEESVRDSYPIHLYKINTGENTAFDQALKYSCDGPSHFFSADLRKEKKYKNERQNWQTFYKSAIVVPIRFIYPDKIGHKDYSHDIGFLCVDTLAPNRLNNRWHLELLSAFADQLYNFICLARGLYNLKESK